MSSSASSSAAKREYDIVVFGATGFTGERIALYLVQLSLRKKFSGRFAIAGRNESKLSEVKNRIFTRAGVKNNSVVVDSIVADVSDTESLSRMASRTTVLISAAGPFRFFGEPVVAACVASGTHYCDVTGEPEFIEKMMVKYDEQARTSNISVVSTCGFDSIPADVGALYTSRVYYNAFPSSSMHEIDSFLSLHIGDDGMKGNTGTWYSLVHGLSSAGILAKIRKQLRAKQTATVPRIGKPTPRSQIFKTTVPSDKPVYALRFPGADASVVRNSQAKLAELQPAKKSVPHYNAYFTLSSTWSVFLVIAMGMLLSLMTKTKFTKKLLLDYPSVFSFGAFSTSGPSQRQIDTCSFSMTIEGKGKSVETLKSDDCVVKTRVSGPEPGYVSTCIMAAQSALQLLKHAKSSDTAIPRGVVTPAVAFGNSDLIEALTGEGVKFETL